MYLWIQKKPSSEKGIHESYGVKSKEYMTVISGIMNRRKKGSKLISRQ
jgi:hypothetical protein